MRILVSHGQDVEGKNACYGAFDGTATGYGPGYQNACIHSGSNDYSGGDTVWYNYATASAGTISENTDSEHLANITTVAAESICPKGWTLPTNTQINSIGNSNINSFSPVRGGYYSNGGINNMGVDPRGYWWGNQSQNGAKRYYLDYSNNGLALGSYTRRNGYYIRCVPKS